MICNARNTQVNDWLLENIVVNKLTIAPLIINPKPIQFKVFNCTNVAQLTVGCVEAKFGEFPHHALLGFAKVGGKKWEYDFKCGGTLISNQHVLTAAHCFSYGDPVIVRLGEYSTETGSDQEYDSDIGSIRLYPNYRFAGSYHDIALIKLNHKVIFSRHIRPACLWMTEERNTTSHIVTGFGANEAFSKVLSPVMMKVQLDDDRRFKQGMQDGQLCVGSTVMGRETCQTYPKACSYGVVGITSTGGVCGIGNSAAIYTKVSRYIDWIEDNV